MARKTLKERRDQIQQELKNLDTARLQQLFKETGSPSHIYRCGLYGTIDKLSVNKFTLFYPGVPHQSLHREPTRIYISQLEEYLNAIKESTPVVLIIYNTGNFGTASVSWNDVTAQKGGFSFNEDDLVGLSATNKEKYAPREGFTACEYCLLQVKDEDVVRKPIWGKYRASAGTTYTAKKEYCFCSEACAMYAQMAKEG